MDTDAPTPATPSKAESRYARPAFRISRIRCSRCREDARPLPGRGADRPFDVCRDCWLDLAPSSREELARRRREGFALSEPDPSEPAFQERTLYRLECPRCDTELPWRESRGEAVADHLAHSCPRPAGRPAAYEGDERPCTGPCGRTLPLEAFGVRRRGNSVRPRSRCKECEAEAARESRRR